MQKSKMMLLTLLIAALAVPSLWAQKKENSGRMSINQIKHKLQSEAGRSELENNGMVVVRSTSTPAVCTGSAGGAGPTGYLAGTNKCTSSVPSYGFGNSLNATAATCADKGGVEGTWAVGMNVATATVAGDPFTSWGGPFNVGGTEYVGPVYYTPAISPTPDVNLTLKRNEGVFGLEIDNTTQQSYSVTFHTTAGDVALPPIDIGGLAEPFSQAQRAVGVCNAAAITGVTVHCNDCSEVSSGPTAVAQIRGDKFPGF